MTRQRMGEYSDIGQGTMVHVQIEPIDSDIATVSHNQIEESIQESAEVQNKETPAVIAKPNDSFWSIAQRVYDDGRYFRALYEFNRIGDGFYRIEPGTRILTPSIEQLREMHPKLCPGFVKQGNQHDQSGQDGDQVSTSADRGVDQAPTYTTRSNDTLFEIAKQQLGQASRYLELIKLNVAILPDNVTASTLLSADIELSLPYHDNETNH